MHKFNLNLSILRLFLASAMILTIITSFYPAPILAQRYELIPTQTQEEQPIQDDQQTDEELLNQDNQQLQPTPETQDSLYTEIDTLPDLQIQNDPASINPGENNNAISAPNPFSSSALSLEISPPVAYIHIKPQDILRHRVLLKNTGTQTLNINVSMADFKADGRTGQPILQPGQLFNRQINPNQSYGETMRLEPEQNQSFNLELDISQLTPEKEYPIAILFNAKTAGGEAGADNSITQVAGTLASNLILFISNSEENQGDIVIQKLDAPQLIDSFGSIKFEILAKNLGKNATPIVGQAAIYNIFNQKIAEYIFYPDYVLADNTRLVRGTELSADIFNQEGKLDPEKIQDLYTKFNYKPPFMFGAYTVEVQLGQQQRRVGVIALPLSLIIAAGLGWVIYFGYIKLLKKVK